MIQDTVHRRFAYVAVVQLADEVQLVDAARDLLVVREVGGKVGAIVLRLGEDSLETRLKALLGRWKVGPTAVLVVGDEAQARALLERARPTLLRLRLTLSGATEDGQTWGEFDEGPLAGKVLPALAPDAQLDWAAFEARTRRSNQRATEQNAFARRLNARKPIVTYTLLAVNLAAFAVEIALGGVDPSVPLLIRLGGIVPDLVRDGEVWRLVSGAFLHGGVMHVGFNLLVLGMLGRFAEQLIGHARFLILYTGSTLAGALASTMFMEGSVSVGASGALWGVLAAQAVFAFAPGFLPPAIVPGARRAAVTNLGLNVFASFMPHVDWAAHAGGGIVGAALLYLVLGRGVPRGAALATDEPTRSPALTAAAVVCGLVLAAGVIAGPVLGGAFDTYEPPTYSRVALEPAHASFEIPADLSSEPATRTGDRVEKIFGDTSRAPALLGVAVTEIPPIPPDQLPEEVAQTLAALRTAPQHGQVSAAPESHEVAGLRALVTVQYTYVSGLLHDIAVAVAGSALLRVDVYYWPEAAVYAEALGRHVIESYQPL